MDKPRIWFIDTVSPYAYDRQTLTTNPQGGTETTVTRIVEALAARGYDVTVAQGVREEATNGAVLYCPIDSLAQLEAPHFIVAIRDPGILKVAKQRWPDAHPMLWLHDITTPEHFVYEDIYKETKPTIVTVSNWHKQQTYEMFKVMDEMCHGMKIKMIYNPVTKGEPKTYDVNKMVWLSSPHKGLEYALRLFERVKAKYPESTFHVLNPGYIKGRKLDQPGVIDLGERPHYKAVAELEDAFCLFYPNTVFPETFGLVMAEAEARGCPVITHPIGAAHETASRYGITNCRDDVGVLKLIENWRDGGRPIVKANPKFDIEEVVAAWINLLTQVSFSRSKYRI